MKETILNRKHHILLTECEEYTELTKRGYPLVYWDAEELKISSCFKAKNNAILMAKEYPMDLIDITTKGIMFRQGDLAEEIERILQEQSDVETLTQRIAFCVGYGNDDLDGSPFSIDVETCSYWYDTKADMLHDYEQLCWLFTINSQHHKYISNEKKRTS